MRQIERYHIHDAIAAGGMASVHLARLASEGGFSKVVAVKAMHAHLSHDPDFRAMFLDEARTVSRIRHTNVVSTLDILVDGDEMILVMDYVHGPSLSSVLRAVRGRGAFVPLPIAAKLVCDLLEGLHAAHEARSDVGAPLNIVHRDVSPHNLLIGADGAARVMDFGIATAADRSYATRSGEVKGKAWYMAPEQARGERVDRRADVYAAGTVLFELLTNRTPFVGSHNEVMFKLFLEPVTPPSSLRSEVPDELDAIVLRSLSKAPSERFATAREMSESIRDSLPIANVQDVADWIATEMKSFFDQRDAMLARLSAESTGRQATAPAVVAETANTLTGAAASSPSRSSWRRTGVSLAVLALLLAAGGIGVRAMQAKPTPTPARTEAPEAAPSSSALVTSAAPAQSELVASTSVPAAPPTSSSSAPSARPRSIGHVVALPRASRPEPPLTAAPAAPPPKCCIQIEGAWQRYSLRPDCVNNCPAGTP